MTFSDGTQTNSGPCVQITLNNLMQACRHLISADIKRDLFFVVRGETSKALPDGVVSKLSEVKIVRSHTKPYFGSFRGFATQEVIPGMRASSGIGVEIYFWASGIPSHKNHAEVSRLKDSPKSNVGCFISCTQIRESDKSGYFLTTPGAYGEEFSGVFFHLVQMIEMFQVVVDCFGFAKFSQDFFGQLSGPFNGGSFEFHIDLFQPLLIDGRLA